MLFRSFTVAGSGVRKPEAQGFIVTAAELANLVWVSGSQNGTERVWVQAGDAAGFGAWTSWTMTSQNVLPVSTPASANRTLHAGQTVAAGTLFSATDGDGDAIVRYQFHDEGTDATSGYFTVAGSGVRKPEAQGFIVTAAELANLVWVSGSQNGTERVWVQAGDAAGFGAWTSWTMSTGNSLPASIPIAASQALKSGQSIAAEIGRAHV